MKRLIYLSCPITKGPILANVANADAAMLSLIRLGFAVVNPALTCYAGAAGEVVTAKQSLAGLHGLYRYHIRPDATAHGDFVNVTHADWIEQAKVIVPRCDAVLRLPGESVGADVETAHAAGLGIPVFHSLDELRDHFEADTEVLTRPALVECGFVPVSGWGGNAYRHPCGLEVTITTKEEFDDHANDPWWWSFGKPNTRIPVVMNPTTDGELRELLAYVKRKVQS